MKGQARAVEALAVGGNAKYGYEEAAEKKWAEAMASGRPRTSPPSHQDPAGYGESSATSSSGIVTVAGCFPDIGGQGTLDAADAWMDEVKQFTHLRVLHLAGSLVTDAGVRKVAGLDRLEEVDLSQTAVTDAALETLIALPRLRYLNLLGTNPTDGGLRRLRGFEVANLTLRLTTQQRKGPRG